MQRLVSRAVVLALAAVCLAACGGSKASTAGTTTPPVTAPAQRPASTAKLAILAPANGATVHGTTAQVRIQLEGAHIVKQATTHITPDTGHLHVYLDGNLVSMSYQITDQLTQLKPGTHLLRVEFVAADHLPFDPRVVRQSAFQVLP